MKTFVRIISWLSWFIEDLALAIDRTTTDEVARQAMVTRKQLPL